MLGLMRVIIPVVHYRHVVSFPIRIMIMIMIMICEDCMVNRSDKGSCTHMHNGVTQEQHGSVF